MPVSVPPPVQSARNFLLTYEMFAAALLPLADVAEPKTPDCVEVCAKKDDAAVLRLYEKAGFTDTGYVDEDVPDCRNLRYSFP